MLKLADLIKAALNEVGCEELPSGCDDLSVDQSFIENNISTNEQPVSDIFLSLITSIPSINFKISVLVTFWAKIIINFRTIVYSFIKFFVSIHLYCWPTIHCTLN